MYQTQWQRPDNPTRDLSEKAMLDHYKTHAVEHDCAFALRPGTTTPADILAGWQALVMDLNGRSSKASDRVIVEQLRACWRAAAIGASYTVPVVPVTLKKTRKIAAPVICQHCGKPALKEAA